MRAQIQVDGASLERVRAAVDGKLSRIAELAAEEAERSSGEVADLAQATWPVATGQSRERVRALAGRWDEEQFETGVAVGATENGQEIRIERGDLNVHTSMGEHDPGGRKCSSGDAGGWGEGDEPVNVREQAGDHLEANPAARRRPLIAAVLEIWGDVVNESAGLSFRKGTRNHYPAAMGLFGKLRGRIAGVVRAGLK